jgi:tripartite-type tricarboxylate transporter receptor subunit TctC
MIAPVGNDANPGEAVMKVHACIRHFGVRVAVLLACSTLALPASAQEWPARTVTVVVPLGAGSASDIMARVVAEQLGKQLGQTFVVENRPGAGGTIGAGMVAKSAPDGYTVLAYGALATAHALHTKLPYDTLNDFVPVIPFGQQPLVVVTAPGKGYKALGDLVAAARAKPGALNYSSAGIGTASHFAAERLRVSAGIEAQHVAFKGAAEAVTEVVAERIDFSPQLFTTRCRCCATASSWRSR